MLRKYLTLVVFLIFLFSVSSPASADDFIGRAECGTDGGPGCDVTAESEDQIPAEPPSDGGDHTPPQEQTEAVDPCDDDGVRAWCTSGPRVDAEEEDEGVDLQAIAHQARASLSLDDPAISMSPNTDTPVLVHVPVWTWIDPDHWQEQSATASVPGGSVTVTATPTSVTWQMGDGMAVDCDGAGTPYDSAMHAPEESSPDCGHTYSTTGTVDVRAQISWETEWTSSGGEGGSLPSLMTETSTSVRMIESSGVVT